MAVLDLDEDENTRREGAIRVLIADAQRLFAESLAIALAHRPDMSVVDVYATDGISAVRAAHDHRPHVVLLDYWIPGIAASAATRSILERCPDTRVLLLSWLHGPPQIQDGLSAGAAGFLPKSVTFDQVADAVRRAHAGEALVYGVELARLMEAIEERAEAAEEEAQRLFTLSVREIEVLQLLSRGLAPKEIAQQLAISVGTVKNHIHKILMKTGAASQAQAVTMARRARLIADVGPPGQRPGHHWYTP